MDLGRKMSYTVKLKKEKRHKRCGCEFSQFESSLFSECLKHKTMVENIGVRWRTRKKQYVNGFQAIEKNVNNIIRQFIRTKTRHQAARERNLRRRKIG